MSLEVKHTPSLENDALIHDIVNPTASYDKSIHSLVTSPHGGSMQMQFGQGGDFLRSRTVLEHKIKDFKSDASEEEGGGDCDGGMDQQPKITNQHSRESPKRSSMPMSLSNPLY